MGINFMFSSCSCDSDSSSRPVVIENEVVVEKIVERFIPGPGNPNPKNFEIKQMQTIGDFVAVRVHYPDCDVAYQSAKIMVFSGVTEHALLSTNFLDPHFCDNPNHPSPIARFEPTKIGWKMARALCYMLSAAPDFVNNLT